MSIAAGVPFPGWNYSHGIAQLSGTIQMQLRLTFNAFFICRSFFAVEKRRIGNWRIYNECAVFFGTEECFFAKRNYLDYFWIYEYCQKEIYNLPIKIKHSLFSFLENWTESCFIFFYYLKFKCDHYIYIYIYINPCLVWSVQITIIQIQIPRINIETVI